MFGSFEYPADLCVSACMKALREEISSFSFNNEDCCSKLYVNYVSNTPRYDRATYLNTPLRPH